MKSKSGKMFQIIDIEEKLKKIEKNERKLETLCSRVDNFENLSLTNNTNNNNGRSTDDGNSQEQLVNNYLVTINEY